MEIDDAKRMSAIELATMVKKLVEKSRTTAQAKEKITSSFPLLSWLSVQERGMYQFSISLKPYPGAPHHTIICDHYCDR